jgi:hypothetical protein
LLEKAAGELFTTQPRHSAAAVEPITGKDQPLTLFAVARLAPAAAAAFAAEGEADHHPVAGLERLHVAPDRLHDAAALVAEHAGCGVGLEPVDRAAIGAAHAATRDADQHLVIIGRIEFDLLEFDAAAGERAVGLFHHGCGDAHESDPFVRAAHHSAARASRRLASAAVPKTR